MQLKLNLFWKELVLFGATLAVGLFSAYRHIPLIGKEVQANLNYSWNDIIILLISVSVISLLFIKFKKISAISLKFFLLLVIFWGSRIIFESISSSPWDLVLALALTVIFIFVHSVLIHNVAILLGIAGVAGMLGITLDPKIGVILLVVLSFYDILAVYWTKHMVGLAKGMIESGAIFGFIIPFNARDFFYHKLEARQQIGDKFMILGSGDIGLPMIMVGSVAVISVSQAIIVALFSLSGLFLTHILFVNQNGRKPMAALPSIATMTIVGYLISLI